MSATLDNRAAGLGRKIAQLEQKLRERTAERDEALAREAALAEVLDAINRSSGNPRPVFEAILEKAMRLCGAAFGELHTYNGERFHTAALRGVPAAYAEVRAKSSLSGLPGSGSARILETKRPVHIPDLMAEEAYQAGLATRRAVVDLGGARTTLAVPLLKEGAVLGLIMIYRQEVRPFSDKEIALLESFAAQALIAMENARLLGELQQRTDELAARNSEYGERIEHQAATIDVLKVMSASPGDPQPVFDLIVRQARELCKTPNAVLLQFDGELVHIRAMSSGTDEWGEALARYESNFPTAPTRSSLACRAILDGEIVHTRDLDAERGIDESIRALGHLSSVNVPMVRDGRAVGAISTAAFEVDAFSPSQIELLQTFAEQAVIALASAETYRELQQRTGDLEESLEYQTATSEVLKVISRSTFDLQPVLDTLVETAARLCGADTAHIVSREGEIYRAAATFAYAPDFDEFVRTLSFSPDRGTVVGRVLLDAQVVHLEDATADPDYIVSGAVRKGARTLLGVPLLRAGEPLGVIVLVRLRVEPFTEREIELVRTFADQAVIAIENTRLITETREALEQQTATAEILEVINRSPGDLAPVFEAMLDKALGLCGAAFGVLWTYDGERVHAAALRGVPPAFAEFLTRAPHPVGPDNAHGRLLRGELVVHIADVAEDKAHQSGDPIRGTLVELGGGRTLLAVPLRKDGAFLGDFVIYRTEVRPFTSKQIALLQNFAAQAVIAMENARLLTETREALEQQTATADVLQVINSSPGDLEPVFDTMLEKAHALCGAPLGSLVLVDGAQLRAVATRGYPQEYERMARRGFSPTSPFRMLLSGQPFVHAPDPATQAAPNDEDPMRRAAVEIAGIRTALFVPLRKDATVLGYISAQRQAVRPFTDKEIALLQNFAAQAVIAIENARLIAETREALEQQTATAEVLQVINSSPGDLAPVFDAMLERAVRLCEFDFSSLWTFDGVLFRPVARHGVPERFWQYLQAHTPPPFARLLAGERLVHIPDVQSIPALMRTDFGRGLLELGIEPPRSLLIVSLRKDDALLGVIVAYRHEVRPFTDKQIALLQNFGAQAVIAMENARLLTETREALEQQTATAEVLQVINSSPGNLAPVFDEMLEKAHRLCGVTIGALEIWDGERLRALATRGLPAPFEEMIREGYRPDPNDAHWQLVDGAGFVHIPDQAAADDPMHRRAAELTGVRTFLGVALRKDNTLLGRIVAGRPEVRPFSEKQIALLQNFAAQAVIAMENARLLTETREALEQQTATAEVLQVINSSPGDLAPVFDAMLERAMRLCDAAFGNLWTYDGEVGRLAAIRGAPPEYRDELMRAGPQKPEPGGSLMRLVEGEPLVHIADITTGDAYRSGNAVRRMLADRAGARTVLWMPLRKDDALLGFFAIYRTEVRPFTDKQIALLENFAAQAVIAMENVRLITETREALEQQTATAEVLQVINSSPGNLAPVYAAILEKAHNLCGIAVGTLQLYDGAKVRTVAQRGVTGRFADLLREPYEPALGHPASRLLGGERIVHIMDHGVGELAKQQPGNPRAQASAQQGLRTALWVPLRKEAELLGYISALRQEVRPFSEKEIALLQNFAAQAVIAMDNARLLNEIRQRQAELRVTFDSMADGVVMFDEELRLAAWNRNFQEIIDLSDAFLGEPRTYRDYIRLLAERGEFGAVDPEDEIRRYTENAARHTTVERTRPDGRVLEVRHNPVPSGGFVLIYADITERKRSEAEIRAARDAAEEASRIIAAAYQELKTAQARLIQAEKMASLGQLTAGIAHEIKNPLNFVNNFAGLSVELLDELKAATQPAMAGLDEDSRGEIDEIVGMLTGNLEKIAEHGRRADGIVKSMLEHSRGGSGERREVDLNKLVEEALSLAYHGARAQDQNFNITLERDFAASIAPIELAPQEMTRVLLNLFGNGFYAATKRRRDGIDPDFHPMLKVTTRDPGAVVEVHIRDNGAGIPPEIRDKLFQPFFTTKPTGEGTGLGLSISWDIVTQQHGGTITVDSRVGEFTEFVIHLPRIRRATTTIEAAA